MISNFLTSNFVSKPEGDVLMSEYGDEIMWFSV